MRDGCYLEELTASWKEMVWYTDPCPQSYRCFDRHLDKVAQSGTERLSSSAVPTYRVLMRISSRGAWVA